MPIAPPHRFAPDRRAVLGGLAAALVAGPLRAAPAGPLTFWGPPAAPSVTLAHAIASGALQALDRQAAFKTWRTPDEMRAGLSSGTMQAVIAPTNVVANLYNRGLGIRLVTVMTRGLLYVVADGRIAHLGDLRGRKLAVPFRNDMPDFILRRLMAEAALKPGSDVAIDYAGTPPEAVQMLLAGRVDAALLAEPLATAAILRGKLSLAGLSRAIDCQAEWARASGGAGFIPQAGLAVTSAFIDRYGPAGLQTLQAALETATAFVVDHPLRASVSVATEFGVMSPIVAESIAHSNLIAQPASQARNALESFFAVLAGDDSRIIGGKLPDDAFYAL